MKPINFKAAKAAIQRKRYADRVLAEFDKLDHKQKRETKDNKSEVERKARHAI